MPRETIEISLSEARPPFEAASELLSYIAYPTGPDRAAFSAALCRWAHLTSGSDWKHSPQLVRPWIFCYPEDVMFASLTKGGNVLRRRVATASLMLLPQLKSLSTGNAPPKLLGFEPTVENISLHISEYLGWSPESYSNLKSKVWAPTKPIAHLAYSFANEVLFPRCIEYRKSHPGEGRPIVEFLFPLPTLEELHSILIRAEKIRNVFPFIKQFRIPDEITLQFISV